MSAPARGVQLTLPAPPPPARYGVIVDEIRLGAIGCSDFLNWWLPTAWWYEDTGRARTLERILPGAIIEYGPFNQDDAQFIHDHMVSKGAHPKGLKVRRWTEEPHGLKCRTAAPCRLCERRSAP